MNQYGEVNIRNKWSGEHKIKLGEFCSMIKQRKWPSPLWMQPKRMFSGISYENEKRINLLYWHLNPYVYDRLCDDHWSGPERHFSKYVINAPWWEWISGKNLEIYCEMHHMVMDDCYVYVAFTRMLPQDETFWRLKWNVIHKKDME